MKPLRQLWLQFGTAQHFDLLHGQHHERVALAHSSASERWNDHGGTVEHETAQVLALDMAARRDWNAYISQSGFASAHRRVSDVSALTTVFADLDTYKVPGLDGLSPDELLDRIIAQHPWFPVPTMAIHSGRGHYLAWVLARPLDRQHLHRWQAVTDALIDLLRAFGADPACRDAARVLRIVGSVNQRSGREVVGYQSGPAITFERLESLILSHAAPILTRPRSPRLEIVGSDGEVMGKHSGSNATAKQRAQHLRPYKLASDRMHDCSVLAGLRGSPRMRDGRHRLLYVYAVSGAWYWSGLEQAHDELDAFARQHFDRADRYNSRRVQTVLDLMEKQLAGRVSRIENGARSDWRYAFTNRYILRLLEITAQEQAQLRTIIGADEVKRRRTGRRRQAGMVERGAYLSTAQERRLQAVEMRSRGMKQADIARELGVSQQAVSWMLKHG